MLLSRLHTIITAILFSFILFSAPLFASDNRPAMDANSTSTEAAIKNQADTNNRPTADTPVSTQKHLSAKPTADKNKPANMPSSVELMMQRQSGTVLQQLPAKAMQPGETISIQPPDQPRRGASMNEVKQELGEPLSTTPAVGKPPITKWIYADRIVYFEYSSTIDVVAR